MISHSIFDFNDYRNFLEKSLSVKGETRGFRTNLAKFLGCRLSHITQVIGGLNHLSLEFSYKTATFLKLSKSETHFFLLLVNKDRSGDFKLSQYFQEQIDQIHKERSKVIKRLEVEDHLTTEQIMHYYSSWSFSAVHLLCSLPQINSTSDIVDRLNISLEHAQDVTDFLIEIGILKNTKSGLATSGRRIHLKDNSKMVSKHHTNWRMKAIQSFDKTEPENLHFSGVYSFAKKDWKKLKETLLKSLEQSDLIIKDSPQDTVGVISLDFFEI
jgi:uncharacterized protein (TIGR02147 family)